MEAHHFRETGWPDTSYDPLSPPPSARLPQVMPVFYMSAGGLHVCSAFNQVFLRTEPLPYVPILKLR